MLQEMYLPGEVPLAVEGLLLAKLAEDPILVWVVLTDPQVVVQITLLTGNMRAVGTRSSFWNGRMYN